MADCTGPTGYSLLGCVLEFQMGVMAPVCLVICNGMGRYMRPVAVPSRPDSTGAPSTYLFLMHGPLRLGLLASRDRSSLGTSHHFSLGSFCRTFCLFFSKAQAYSGSCQLPYFLYVNLSSHPNIGACHAFVRPCNNYVLCVEKG